MVSKIEKYLGSMHYSIRNDVESILWMGGAKVSLNSRVMY